MRVLAEEKPDYQDEIQHVFIRYTLIVMVKNIYAKENKSFTTFNLTPLDMYKGLF